MSKLAGGRRPNVLNLSTALLAVGVAFAGAAAAEEGQRPEGAWDSPGIVPNNTLDRNQPPPAGVLDSGVTGVGQMVTDVPPPGGQIGLCTGSLINPRAVIFAAHCVNVRPAAEYGSAQGGVALSFGFNPDNRPAAINWINNNWRTNTALNIYNANQVWYDPRSLSLGAGLNFLQADVAIATLDTRADNIPTWTLLFSPLTAPTHVKIVGYGATGDGTLGAFAGIDFRRRAAENMLDSLASINDRNLFLFGTTGTPPLPQTLYSFDFDDPLRGQPGANPFDFDLFDGDALPRESTTAGGDSGGPLIVDQLFEKEVIAGVLSGGSRFFAAQPFSAYGTQSFYQPLFMFWDVIVQNNPYAYVSAKSGNADWFDAGHWVQDMDPNYSVIRNGALANDLPDTPAQGVTGDTVKFGDICFLDDCVDVTRTGPGVNSAGPGLVIPGGPGSQNFVPNNVEPNRLTGVKARYYDVTLSRVGRTTLRSGQSARIDALSLTNGRAELRIDSDASLAVVGDLTASAGFVDLDGALSSGEALFVRGVLLGRGVFDPTFFTSVAGAIAPAGADVGTLTIKSDVVLASGSQLFVEVGRNGADQLRVVADPTNGAAGDISLGGDLRMVKAAQSAAPKHGQTFSIVLADGSVLDRFDRVFAQTGVLRPEVDYTPNAVVITLRAGKFADVIEGSPQELAFANALDRLRDGSYGLLEGLYGQIDTLDFASMSRAFSALKPATMMDGEALLSLQARNASDLFSGRLDALARGAVDGSLSIGGDPRSAFASQGAGGLAPATAFDLAGAGAARDVYGVLPDGFTMFLSGGSDREGASSRSDGLETWNIAGGLERAFGAFSLGVAAAHSDGRSRGDFAANVGASVTQAAIYGVRRFGDGAYVSMLAGAGEARFDGERSFTAGGEASRLSGAADGRMSQLIAEAGRRIALGDRTALTPKAQLRQSVITIGAHSETGGPAALAFDETTIETLEARLGFGFEADYRVDGWRIAPNVTFAAVSNLAGAGDGVWTRFAAAPDGRFLLPGEARDAAWAEAVGGLALVRGGMALGLTVDASLGREDRHDDRLVASFSQRW